MRSRQERNVFGVIMMDVESFTPLRIISRLLGLLYLSLLIKAVHRRYDKCNALHCVFQVHERAHTGDKPYCCDLPGCGKKFATGIKNTL